jgi:hypothetical protein
MMIEKIRVSYSRHPAGADLEPWDSMKPAMRESGVTSLDPLHSGAARLASHPRAFSLQFFLPPSKSGATVSSAFKSLDRRTTGRWCVNPSQALSEMSNCGQAKGGAGGDFVKRSRQASSGWEGRHGARLLQGGMLGCASSTSTPATRWLFWEIHMVISVYPSCSIDSWFYMVCRCWPCAHACRRCLRAYTALKVFEKMSM